MSKYNDHGYRFTIKGDERIALTRIFMDFMEYYSFKSRALLLTIFNSTIYWRRIETEWGRKDDSGRQQLSRLTQHKIVFKTFIKGKPYVAINIPGVIQWCLQYLYIPDNDVPWTMQVVSLQDKFMNLWKEEGLPMKSVKSKKPRGYAPPLKSLEKGNERAQLEADEMEAKAETVRRDAIRKSQGSFDSLCDRVDELCRKAKRPGLIQGEAISKSYRIIDLMAEDQELDQEGINKDVKAKIAGQLRNFLFEQREMGYSPSAIIINIMEAWKFIRAQARLEPSFFSLPWLLANKSEILEKTKGFIEWQKRKEAQKTKSLGN